MKKVEAIIRKTKFDDVQEALREAGIDFITFWDVRGVGKSTQARIYRGIKYDTSSIERTMVTFYCREKYLKPALAAIQASAKTGQVGDGKIFISDITDGIRIRTGESGEKSVYIEDEA
ncbi:MAG: P-II family nitrogen regulator [Bacteroidales bacterium]|nr:P-II family nitrogen regulator [Bacteroidales bacterium]